MNRFQYCVMTKAGRNAAWELYIDWPKWGAYANIYGGMKWTKGEPWKVGSQLELEIVRPVELVVQHSITELQPQRQIGWVDQGLGITISQWVSFEDVPRGGTEIYTEGEISPTGAVVGGKSVDRLVRVFTETWYENFRSACDKLHEAEMCEPRV